MNLLVIDVGTSSIRAAIVRPGAGVTVSRHHPLLPDSPAPGLVEFDARAMAEAVLDLGRAVLAEGGPVDAVGITNQRASAVVWDRATGEPVGPGIGWQDLRTVIDCLTLGAQGVRLAPNLTATKAAHLLDLADPDRTRDLCIGTVDSWLVWTLTGGARHVTDVTNVGLTGLRTADQLEWDQRVLDALRIPTAALPEVVDSSGVIGEATALPGAPPIAGILGDQQASLLGQGCVAPGDAKITFGTGGMLDLCLSERPTFATQGSGGTFPIVTRGLGGQRRWGLEAVMLAAGTNVEWLRDDLGIIDDTAQSDELAASVDDADGVVFVPAPLGLGTPHWDYGARSGLFGLTRGSTKAHVARAVLEGVAQRGAELLAAAEADSGASIDALRVDGGMSQNRTFIQALANAIQRPVEVSPVLEATARGGGLAAGVALGWFESVPALADLWQPAEVIEPNGAFSADRWAEAVRRVGGWHPELSAINF